MAKRKDKAYKVSEEGKGIGCLGSVGVFLLLVLAGMGLMIAGAGDSGGIDIGRIGETIPILQDEGEQPNDDGSPEAEGEEAAQDEEAEEEEQSAELARELEGYYYYSQLGEADRRKYEVMYTAFVQRTQGDFPSTSNEDLERIYECVMGDHPELFYVSGVSTSIVTGSDVAQVEGSYIYSEDEAAQLAPQIDAAVSEAIAGIPDDADDYAKAKHVYEYLVGHVTYDHAALEALDSGQYLGQTVVDSLIDGNAVCAGYSRAFQMAMYQMGIPCAYVSGVLNDGESHSWCLVQLDGEYYYIDPTFGDPSYSDDAGGSYETDTADYTYLGITTADAQLSRTFDRPNLLPECTSDADNYYVREGRVLSSFDTAQLQQWWDDCMAAGGGDFQFRCADADVYSQVLDGLSNGTIFAGGVGYTYNNDDDMHTLIVSPDM